MDLGEGGYDAVANSVGVDGSTDAGEDDDAADVADVADAADAADAGDDDDTKQYEARKGRLAWLKLLQTFPPYLQS